MSRLSYQNFVATMFHNVSPFFNCLNFLCCTRTPILDLLVFVKPVWRYISLGQYIGLGSLNWHRRGFSVYRGDLETYTNLRFLSCSCNNLVSIYISGASPSWYLRINFDGSVSNSRGNTDFVIMALLWICWWLERIISMSRQFLGLSYMVLGHVFFMSGWCYELTILLLRTILPL